MVVAYFFVFLLMAAAIQAAPKPLSMLTTQNDAVPDIKCGML